MEDRDNDSRSLRLRVRIEPHHPLFACLEHGGAKHLVDLAIIGWTYTRCASPVGTLPRNETLLEGHVNADSPRSSGLTASTTTQKEVGVDPMELLDVSDITSSLRGFVGSGQ